MNQGLPVERNRYSLAKRRDEYRPHPSTTQRAQAPWLRTTPTVAAGALGGLAEKLTIVRAFGVMAMLPLFVAAGAVMFPTVAGCGLAYARVEWRTITRSLCVLMATGPVLFVASDFVGSFGWSLRALAGFVIFLAIYATIIWATRFTFSAQLDGWRMTRRAKVAVALLVAVLFTILFFAGGGFK